MHSNAVISTRAIYNSAITHDKQTKNAAGNLNVRVADRKTLKQLLTAVGYEKKNVPGELGKQQLGRLVGAAQKLGFLQDGSISKRDAQELIDFLEMPELAPQAIRDDAYAMRSIKEQLDARGFNSKSNDNQKAQPAQVRPENVVSEQTNLSSRTSVNTKPATQTGQNKASSESWHLPAFGGQITSNDQTLGGKQSALPGAKSNQLRHRTGLSRYDTDGTTESFRAGKGGTLAGISKSPRSEAYFNGETTGKFFSASYQVNGAGQTTIFQQFGRAKPSIRVVSENGEISVANVDNSPQKLADVKPGEIFQLKVKDLGNQTARISIADEKGRLLGSDIFPNARNGENPKNYQFRYGAYYGGQSEVQVLVRDVKTDIKG